MGLQRVWLDVARRIGVDAFLTMWRVLDEEPSTHSRAEVITVTLRGYRSYIRFQRNRYIESLAGMDVKPPLIKQRLLRQMGQDLSLQQIQRLIKQRERRE